MLTYGEFDRRANKLAHALKARGVGPGDHVGVHLYNSVEYLEVMLAAFKLRAVPINLNYRYVSEELRYLFDNAELVAVFTQRELLGVVEDAAAGNTRIHTYVYVDDGSDLDAASLGAAEYEAFVADQPDTGGWPERSADDLLIIYTGGTTGMPRGVMWRHEDIFFAGMQGGRPGDDPIERPEQISEGLEPGSMREPPNIHPAAPLIHGAAQLASFISLLAGGTVGLVRGRSFDPKRTLKLVSDHGMNVVNMVGDAMMRPFTEELAANRDAYDLDTLVAISSAGAILSETVKTQITELLPYTMILNNYGASETGHQGTALDMGDGKLRFFMHGDHTTVLREDRTPVEAGSGEVGHIARTGHIPLGYYGDPEKTARTFFTDGDGRRWVIPGDMGILEETGAIIMLGRGSVCINTGGEKVYPEEVEEALKAHPEVFDAIVVGVPDERWGERVNALVLPREGYAPELASIEEHCRCKVAGYKVPRQIWIVDTLNRQPSGKPDYRWAKAKAIELNEAAG